MYIVIQFDQFTIRRLVLLLFSNDPFSKKKKRKQGKEVNPLLTKSKRKKKGGEGNSKSFSCFFLEQS